jgi:hypothetical protein
VPSKLTIFGVAAYGLIALSLVVEAVLMVRHSGPFAELQGWGLAALLVIVVLACLLVTAGAVTRRGLLAADGPWIYQNGWGVLIGLTAVNLVLVMLWPEGQPDQAGLTPWATGYAIFLPHFVRRMEEAYYDGVAEAEREIAAVRALAPDEEPPPGR